MRYCSYITIVAALCWSGAGIALGQYELGDGTGLDANMQQGSGGVNAPRVRNTAGQHAEAVITGNVTGLGSFRGDLGYGAPSEFRDQLGSDDNFSFYRHSYGSAAPLRSRVMGGSNVYQPNRGRASGGERVIIRSGAGATLSDITGNARTYGGLEVTSRDQSPLSEYQTYTRSPSRFNRDSALYAQQRLAVSRDDQGRLMEVTSSPLRGVHTKPLASTTIEDLTTITPEQVDGELPNLPDARLDATLDPRTEQRVDDRGRPLRESQLIAPPVALGERLGSQVIASAYLDQTQSAEAAEELASLNKSLDTLLGSTTAEPGQDVYMDLLRRIRGEAAEAEPRPGERPIEQPAANGQPDADDEPAEDADADDEAAEDEPPARKLLPGAAERNAVIEDALAKLDYEIEAINTLAGTSKSIFNQAMREAEQHLRDERYFDAETAYNRALRLRPGYPLAIVGRAHAQLGAGMFTSSARSFRTVFNAHPELIAARYQQPLMPDDDHLATLNERLDNQLQRNTVATGPALLRAYIAYQQKDARALGEALHQMRKRNATDPLLPLLQRIWSDWDKDDPEAPGQP